ncbi:MAG: PKD domain-containing protein [Bacteroidia bacterium]|nr:PKD domain-containing protein [Bacteroidia bacterium]
MRKIYSFLVLSIILISFYSCRKEVEPVPTAAYSFTPLDTCNIPTRVVFNNLSTNATVFRWNYGDGTPVEYKPNPTHIYNTEGIYTIELTAYGKGGMHVERKVVYIVRKPAFDFTVSDTAVFVGDSVRFNCQQQGGIFQNAWLWSFGDGYSTSLKNTAHSYSYPGLYSIVLSGVNSCGTTFIERKNLVHVKEVIFTPVTDFTADHILIATGQIVDFFDLSINNPTSWSWTFQGGSPSTANVKNPANITYFTAGYYDVTLTASNQQGSDTKTKTQYIQVVTTGSAPVPDFIADQTIIMPGQPVNFTDLSVNNPTSWNWTFPGGNPSMSTLQNPTNIFYPFIGSYDVSLTVSNLQGSNTMIKTAYIQVQNIVQSAQITKITVFQFPFPIPPQPQMVNLYFKITDFAATVYIDARSQALLGVTPMSLPVFWNLNPPFQAPVLNQVYKIELWDKKGMMPENDIPINFVQFNLNNYPNHPPTIPLNQNGLIINLDITWQ